MKRGLLLPMLLLSVLVVVSAPPSRAGFMDTMIKDLGLSGNPATSSATSLDDSTIIKGLKEALSTGTGRAVAAVSKQDGYFGNQMIKIFMPEKLRSAADLVSKFGFRNEVDDVILGMNRAAEKAAPKAMNYFLSALKTMTFDDARKILKGDATSATEYFREKTGDDIYSAFKPVVSANLQDVGAVQSYKQMTKRLNSIPFAGSAADFDLDNYVTNKAVEGLFKMLGEEETKIRTDPAARGTELLRKVFGK